MERLIWGCLLPPFYGPCMWEESWAVYWRLLPCFSHGDRQPLNVTTCLFSNRSGANLAVNDNNGSFISTLSMHLYKVGAHKGPSQGPTTWHLHIPFSKVSNRSSQFPSRHVKRCPLFLFLSWACCPNMAGAATNLLKCRSENKSDPNGSFVSIHVGQDWKNLLRSPLFSRTIATPPSWRSLQ